MFKPYKHFGPQIDVLALSWSKHIEEFSEENWMSSRNRCDGMERFISTLITQRLDLSHTEQETAEVWTSCESVMQYTAARPHRVWWMEGIFSTGCVCRDNIELWTHSHVCLSIYAFTACCHWEAEHNNRWLSDTLNETKRKRTKSCKVNAKSTTVL